MAPRRRLEPVPSPSEGADDVRATDGRVPGHRGQATRRRLLDCTADLLGRTSYRDVKVIDIAREAGTSPATFYQYFPDVEHAVLVLAEESAQHATRLVELARGPWRGERAPQTARDLVQGFMDYWDDHRAIFRVVDLNTEEGDLRFSGLRTKALHPLFQELNEAVAASQRDGRLPASTDPSAAAGVLVSMLAHVGAHRYGMEFWGIRTAALVDSLTRIVYWTVTGRAPPASRN